MRSVPLKNRFFSLFIFSMYQTLILWFFGFHLFVGTIQNQFLFLAIMLVCIFIGSIVVRMALKKWLPSQLLIESLSFTFSSVITSLVLYFVVAVETNYSIAYFSGFIVTGAVFSVFYFLYFLFHQLSHQGKFQIKTQQSANEIKNEQHIFQLENSKGRSRLEIEVDHIVCFEANDNYVTIYYENETGKLQRKLERLSMKKVEDLLSDQTDLFIRVHKSYLVQRRFIMDVTGRSQAYKIQLKHFTEVIPVSRKFKLEELQTYPITPKS